MPGGSACGSPRPPATAQELGVHGGLEIAGPNKTLEEFLFSWMSWSGGFGLGCEVSACWVTDSCHPPALEAAHGDLTLPHGQQRGQSSACSWELTLGLDPPLRTGNDPS